MLVVLNKRINLHDAFSLNLLRWTLDVKQTFKVHNLIRLAVGVL